MRGVLLSPKRIGMAVHVMTASGAIAGFIALQNVIDGNIRYALVWLIVCQILDGVDGPIARHFAVDKSVRRIDGHILDLVVDYVTCVVVPVALLIQAHLVSQSKTMWTAGAILLTSALWFAKSDQETTDGWFKGFPAGWNIVVPSFLLLDTSQRLVIFFVAIFCVLQLSDVQFPHVMKARAMRRSTLVVTSVYVLSLIWLSVSYPGGPKFARAVLAVAPIYLTGMVTWRMLLPDRKLFGQSIIAHTQAFDLQKRSPL